MASGGDSFWYGRISHSANNKPGTEEFYIYTPDNSWNASWITIEQIDGSDWCWIDNEKDEGQYVTYIISWDQNYGSARTATFVVTYNYDEMPQGTIEIRQAAGVTYTQSVNPTLQSIGSGGGSVSFSLESNRPSGNWTFSKSSSLTWLTPTIASASAQDTTMSVRVGSNNGTATTQPSFSSLNGGNTLYVAATGGGQNVTAAGGNGSAGTSTTARSGGINIKKSGYPSGGIAVQVYQDGYTPAALGSAALTGAGTNASSWITNVSKSGNVSGGKVTFNVASNVGTQTTQPSQPYFTGMTASTVYISNTGGNATSYAYGYNGAAGSMGVSRAARSGTVWAYGAGVTRSFTVYQYGWNPNALSGLNSAALTGATTTLGSVTYGGNVNGGWVTVSVGSNVGTQTTQPTQPSFSSLNGGNTLYVAATGGGQSVTAAGGNGAAGSMGVSKAARSGTVTVSGAGTSKTFTVYQYGWNPNALNALGSAALTGAGTNASSWITSVAKSGNVNGGKVTFNVASNVGTQTTQPSQPYLTSMSSVNNISVDGGCVTSTASGYNGAAGSMGVSRAARSGTVWASGANATRSFTVYQYGWNPNVLNGLGSAALTGASSNRSWLKVNSYSGNVNGGTVKVCADAQSYYATTQPSQPYLTSMGGVGVVSVDGGSVTSYASGYNGAAGSMGKTALARTATVTVTGAGYSKTFNVTQNGYTPAALNGLGSAALTGASSNKSWATISARSGNVNGGYVTVNVAKQTYKATTASSQPYLSSIPAVTASAEGGVYSTTASGFNGVSGTYGTPAYGRTATITVTGAGYSKTFYVGQYGYSPAAVTALNSAVLKATGTNVNWITGVTASGNVNGGIVKFNVAPNTGTQTTQPSWSSMSNQSVVVGGAGFTSTSNGSNGSAGSSTSARTGKVYAYGAGVTNGITVTQNGWSCNGYTSPNITGATRNGYTWISNISYSGTVNGGKVSGKAASNVGTQTTQPTWTSLTSGSVAVTGGGYTSTSTGSNGSAGTSTNGRTATITVFGAGTSRNFYVGQPGWSCNALTSANITSATSNQTWAKVVNYSGTVNGGKVGITVLSNVGTERTNPTWSGMSNVTIGAGGGSGTSTSSGDNGNRGAGTNSRTATITVTAIGTAKTFTVSQPGWSPQGYTEPTLTGASEGADWLTITSRSGNVSGGTIGVTASSNVGTERTNPTFTGMSNVTIGYTGGSVTSTASGNVGSRGVSKAARSATVYVSAIGTTKSFTVTQSAWNPSTYTLPNITSATSNQTWAKVVSYNGGVNGGTVGVTVASNEGTATKQPTWTSVSNVLAAVDGGAYTSTSSGTAGVSGIPKSARTAIISVTAAGIGRTFSVNQDAYNVVGLTSAAIKGASSNASWITGITYSGNVNGGTVKFNVAPQTYSGTTQTVQPSFTGFASSTLSFDSGASTKTNATIGSVGYLGKVGTTALGRTGTITVTTNFGTKTITVGQSGYKPVAVNGYTSPAITSVTDNTDWITASGSGNIGSNISVTVTSNVGTQTTQPTQPTFTGMSTVSAAVGGGAYSSTASGTTGVAGTIGVSRAARSGTVTVVAANTTKSFTVSQAAWNPDNLTAYTSPNITGASSNETWVTGITYSGTVVGGKVSFNVASNEGTATKQPTWSSMSTVSAVAAGGAYTSTSTGNVGYSGTPKSARTAIITVTGAGIGRTFSVNQAAYGVTAYTSPNITGASSNATWITGVTYSGNVNGGTVKFNVAPNTGTQTVSPVWGTINTVSVNENGGSAIGIITGGVIGSLGKTAAARSATVTVNAINTSKTITVNQDALAPNDYSTPTITGASESVDWITGVGYTGTAAEGKVTFTVASNVGTQAVQPTFTSFPAVTTWNYNDTAAKTSKVTTTIGAKGVTKAARSTNITVSAIGISDKTFTVSQSGWNPDSYTTPSLVVTSSNDNFTVSTNSTSAENATITITPKNSNMGTQTVGATFSSLSKTSMSFAHGGGSSTSTASVDAGYEGTPTQDRTSTITAIWGGTTKTITATQKGFTPNAYTAPSYSVSDDADWITTSRSGNTITVNASSNTAIPTPASITLSSNSSTCISAGATGSFTVTTSGYNKTNPARSGKVTVSYGGVTKEITVNQDGHSVSTTLNVTSDSSWLIPTLSGNTVSWVAETNPASTPRTGIITLTYADKEARYVVLQVGEVTYTYMDQELEGDNISNKLITRGEFNSVMRSDYYTTELTRVLTFGELNEMTWDSGDYRYTIRIQNADSYTDNQCVIGADIVRENIMMYAPDPSDI